MVARKTLDDVKTEIHAAHPHIMVLSYAGRNELASANCAYHGPFQAFGRALLGNSVSGGCPACSKISRVDGQQLTQEQAAARLSEAHPSLRLVKYTGHLSDAVLACQKHGEFSRSWAGLLKSGVGCPHCPTSELSASVAAMQLRLPHIRLTAFTTYDGPASGDCSVHGAFEIPSLKTALYRKSHGGCLACARSHQGGKRTLASVQAQVSDLHPHLRVTQWTTHCRPAFAICALHGEFRVGRGQVLTNRTTSGGCPVCAEIAKTIPPTASKEEDALVAWLELQGLEVQRHRRDLLDGRLEVDAYLPALRVGIEYHGVYHHSEEFKAHNYHQRKAQLAERAGIRLIQVFSDEWTFQPLVVQQTLRLLLGLAPKLVARKLQVVEVSVTEARDFYTAHHLQGFLGGRHVGLHDGKALVACATVGQNRFATGLELRRYATAGVAVVGGLARLMRAMTQPGDIVTSYCDLRWFTGKAYLAAGFVGAGTTPPGYFWIRHAKRHSRHQFQKHRIQKLIPNADLSLTETEIATAAGYRRLWDAGHLRFVYTRT